MRILVIRRDNIGDLICTTPLFTALRTRFPEAWIGALVNNYNAPVLAGNSDLNEVLAYTKLKHVGQGESAVRAIGKRLAMLWRLKQMRLDYVLLATTHFVPRIARLARWLAPRQIVGFSDSSPAARALGLSLQTAEVAGKHEVERVFCLASLLGIEGPIPPLRVIADPEEIERARTRLRDAKGTKLAFHISARRPLQRWPAERFAELIQRAHAVYGTSAILLWSPGQRDHPLHPGDDDKAEEILGRLRGKVPVFPYRTERLAELTAALATCDSVVCSDGGAMHIAAALGKRTVALFGDSPPDRWHPWGVEHRVLQAESKVVGDLPVERVFSELVQILGVR